MKNINNVELCGTVITEATFSHNEGNGRMSMLYISVKRNSGTEDILPVVMNESVGKKFAEGDKVVAYGKICSKDLDGHLIIYCKARNIARVDNKAEYYNYINMDGYIVKEPYYRNLGTREIASTVLAVNSGRHAYYIPTICWGYEARDLDDLEIGTKIEIEGRFQSRNILIKDFKEWTTYEVSVKSIVVK